MGQAALGAGELVAVLSRSCAASKASTSVEAVGDRRAELQVGRALPEPPPAFKGARRDAPAAGQVELGQVMDRSGRLSGEVRASWRAGSWITFGLGMTPPSWVSAAALCCAFHPRLSRGILAAAQDQICGQGSRRCDAGGHSGEQ